MKKLLIFFLLILLLFPSCKTLRENTDEIIAAETEFLEEGIELDDNTHWYVEVTGEIEVGIIIDL